MADEIQNDIEDESGGFNALEFANNVYNTIDSYRSQIPAQYNVLVTSAPKSPGGVGETKLNAFYRMIGLPAVSEPEFIRKNSSDDEFSDIISQNGTTNYFNAIYNNDVKNAELFSKVYNRNNQLMSKPNAERFAKFMYEPLPLSYGVNDLSGDRRRPSIFPLVVDAAVPIFPLTRRLSPSFQHTINGEDYIVMGSKSRLSRPLIDNIIYMRLSKIDSKPGLDKLEAQLINLANSIGSKDASELKKIVQDITNEATFIDIAIKTKLLQTLKGLANKFREAIQNVQALSADISFVFAPVSNPAMRSAQNPDIKLDIKAGALDTEIANLKTEIANQNAIAFLLPTEQVKRREEIRRLEHGIGLSNITQDVFVGQLNDLITYEVPKLSSRLAEKQHERDEKLSRAEQLKSLLMYYTGEFSGLSIFDVICVVYGLFSIEKEYLVGLLNSKAQSRLMEDEFFRPTDSTKDASANVLGFTPASVESSLDALQKKITEAFRITEGFASRQDTSSAISCHST